uniref:procollagen-proline 4-dioxygenase n=1 Tax=Arion vulgaris TaxID=1028688 RepID=A0A0B7BN89_9EUPU
MTQSMQCQIVVLTWTATLLGLSHSNVYTSSVKIKNMVLTEENILNSLHTEVINLRNDTALSVFSKFYHHRIPIVKELQNDVHLQAYLKHPNGIYLSIKQFANEYQNLRSALGSQPSPAVQLHLSSIADERDLVGARLSFIRLQKVYSLNASDMIIGNYLGWSGPELDEIDALKIGEAAFTEGHLDLTIQWMYEALAMTKKSEPPIGVGNFEEPVSATGKILALLGRSYLRQGLHEKASEMYTQATYLDPRDDNVIALKHELVNKPHITEAPITDENLQRLCLLQNKLPNNKFDPRLNCVYRQVILPYYRFKQELISVSPYVALFYDVISDLESQSIINFSQAKLKRGMIEFHGKIVKKEYRTSDLSFVTDEEMPMIERLSKRVGDITNLRTVEYKPGESLSAEPFQVVNYGMGGHFSMHYDPLNEITLSRPDMYVQAYQGGNRVATFLIYLSDVEEGGSTVFTKADIAVRPVKNMALFWYSYTPSGEFDTDTVHAGCPVVVGHKWVTNKWMWLYGNTFTRRCGLTQDATQLDIDQHMMKGWA